MPETPQPSTPTTVAPPSPAGSTGSPCAGTTIHPSSIISPHAELGQGVSIGPFCSITGRVTLGDGVRLVANVHLQGPLTIGAGTTVYPGASLGYEPQDYKFTPGMETAGVTIGKRCLIRECVTVHAATNTHTPTTPTTVGDDCYLMAYSHVGHDCVLGNKIILVNFVGLSGHITVDDGATLSGHVGVHQFVRIGRLAFLSGGASVGMDVPPFCMVNERQRMGGVNLVGMRRAGMDRAEITRVRHIFRDFFRIPCTRQEMLDGLRERSQDSPAVTEMAEFVAGTKRGICAGLGKPPRALTTWLHRLRRGQVTMTDLDTASSESDR